MATQYCANCGKKFYTGHGGWGYAYAGHYTCTYHCMREMRRDDMISEQQRTTVRGMIAEGKTAQEIAAETGVSTKVIGGMMARSRHKRAARKTIECPAKAEQQELAEQPVQAEQPPREEGRGPASDTDRMVVGLIHDMLEVIRRIYGM